MGEPSRVDVELAEVRDFLAAHPPFDALPEDSLARLPRRCTMRYARRGTVVLEADTEADGLLVVRSGAVDLTDETGSLVERVGPGGAFGMSTVLEGRPARYRSTAREDTLLLVLPRDDFATLVEQHPAVGTFLGGTHHDRMARALANLQQASATGVPLGRSVRDLRDRAPVVADPDLSVREAAAAMSRAGVSSLMLVREDRLVGILTDRDLRNRVLASGVDPAVPVSEVMTGEPFTLPDNALAFEALLEMVARGIHHLPLVDPHGRPVGLVSTTDLIRLEESNPIYLAADVARADDLGAVAALARTLPAVLTQLLEAEASATEIGRILTAVGDAVRRRVLDLVERDLSPTPTQWAWLALGSVARDEEGLASDQDHALVVAEPGHDEWFAELAERASAALVECGWPRCPGEVMATNPSWRTTPQGWSRHFDRWAGDTGPAQVLHAATFYDLRHLAGDPRLTAAVRDAVTVSPILLGHLTSHALSMRPPLGFFRGFVLDHQGEHRDTLDIKRGIAPLVQLARIYGLRIGSTALSTRDRLTAAEESGLLGSMEAGDLRDALELMSHLRLRHQAGQAQAGALPDNRIAPGDLTERERRHLKDAFGIVRDAQQRLAASLGPGFR